MENEENRLPKYPFTSVGVGGLVVDSKNRLLLMKEKRGIYKGWKFPGGLADPGFTVVFNLAYILFGVLILSRFCTYTVLQSITLIPDSAIYRNSHIPDQEFQSRRISSQFFLYSPVIRIYRISYILGSKFQSQPVRYKSKN